jgi:hypothetical protein
MPVRDAGPARDGGPARAARRARTPVPRRVLLAVVVLLGLLGGAAAVVVARGTDVRSPRVVETTVVRVESSTVRDAPAAARTVDAYRGLGAWVDAFDYSPPYTGPNPPVRASTIDEMAAAGVRTLFLQTGRLDTRSPDLLEDRWLLAELLLAAHQRNLRVVGWFLPKWGDGSADLDHLKAIADFSVLGHRFDGIAVDIEYNADKNPVDERSRRLVTLSNQLRAYVGRDVALGAIVMPPVLLEVVNTDYWPRFPYRELAPIYDVWLPMSYWSFRTTRSGYKDGYAYNAESTRRLRTNLGRPDALVHGIGGIGADDGVNDDPTPEEPHASITDLEPFVRSLRDTKSIGGSLYDWRTTEPAARTKLRDLFATFG